MKEKTRLPYILDHVCNNKCDLVVSTETWLFPDVSKNDSVVHESAEYGLVILWRSCQHAAVDYYFVEISTLIGWIMVTHVLKKTFKFVRDVYLSSAHH